MSARHLNLDSEIEKIEEFHKEWIDDYQEFYECESGQNGDDPPHEQLRRQAEAFIETGMLYRQNHLDKMWSGIDGTGEKMPDEGGFNGMSSSKITLLFAAISAELLLNGILLKEHWECFDELSDYENNRTPPFQKCIQWVMGDLPDSFGDKDRRRVSLIFKLLREHRNNMIHSGYQQMLHQAHEKEVYRVLGFLLDCYYDESPLKSKLEAEITRIEEGEIGLDYENVNFWP